MKHWVHVTSQRLKACIEPAQAQCWDTRGPKLPNQETITNWQTLTKEKISSSPIGDSLPFLSTSLLICNGTIVSTYLKVVSIILAPYTFLRNKAMQNKNIKLFEGNKRSILTHRFSSTDSSYLMFPCFMVSWKGAQWFMLWPTALLPECISKESRSRISQHHADKFKQDFFLTLSSIIIYFLLPTLKQF